MIALDRFGSKVDWPAHVAHLDAASALRALREEGYPSCVEWTAGDDGKGYGAVWIGGPGRKAERSHRLALLVAVGSPPPGRPCALHACDNRRCVNPAHLRWGTNEENVRDRASRARSAIGERVGNAKLTTDQVREIDRRLTDGHRQIDIAADFGVSSRCVRGILTGRSWSHLTGRGAR